MMSAGENSPFDNAIVRFDYPDDVAINRIEKEIKGLKPSSQMDTPVTKQHGNFVEGTLEQFVAVVRKALEQDWRATMADSIEWDWDGSFDYGLSRLELDCEALFVWTRITNLENGNSIYHASILKRKDDETFCFWDSHSD